MNLTRQSALIAAHAHRSEIDNNGNYFDSHLINVAENVHFIASSARWSEKERVNAEALAFLHEVYDKKLMTLLAVQKDLSVATDIPNASWLTQTLKHYSRKTDETYDNYIKRICSLEPIILQKTVLTVKAADLLADISSKPSDELMKRYQKALGKVSSKLYDERAAINEILINSQL